MKFYVTGRSNNYPRVEEAFRMIKERGHTVTFEWTSLPMAKPYAENQVKAAEYAKMSIQGVLDADVYIIFSHEDGNGVYAELGAALASNMVQNRPRIFAIGNTKDSAMFNYHPAIMWKDCIEDVFDELKKNI